MPRETIDTPAPRTGRQTTRAIAVSQQRATTYLDIAPADRLAPGVRATVIVFWRSAAVDPWIALATIAWASGPFFDPDTGETAPDISLHLSDPRLIKGDIRLEYTLDSRIRAGIAVDVA